MKREEEKVTGNEDYIDKITEWQENQYNPGHYTGGKIPPFLHAPGNPRLLAWVFIIPNTIGVLTMVLILYANYSTVPLVATLLLAVAVLGWAALYIVAGIRLLKKSKAERK